VPARTVSRVLVRHGQPRLAALDSMTGQVIRSSKQTATRYERSRPGELVHVDVKKLGRIPDGGGWRAHGRAAVSTRRDRVTRVGFDYVHSLVDDHSRLAHSEILPAVAASTFTARYSPGAVVPHLGGRPQDGRILPPPSTHVRWLHGDGAGLHLRAGHPVSKGSPVSGSGGWRFAVGCSARGRCPRSW
jgi:Integrase core domain